MRRSALVAAVVLTMFGAVNTPAQQPAFRSGVSLVTIDVTVLDKDGKPVPGLSSDDFEVKLGGKVQPVRAIAFVQASNGAAPAPAEPKPSDKPAATTELAPRAAAAIVAKEVEVRRTIDNQDNVETPPVVAAPAPVAAAGAPVPTAAPGTRAHQSEPRTFVLLIDDLSFPAQNGRGLFASASRFVSTVPATDPLGLATTSGSPVVNPTLDRTALLAALKKVAGQYVDPRTIDTGGASFAIGASSKPREQPIGIDEALEIDRGNDTLLREVIIRECGGQAGTATGTAQEMIAANPCAGGIKVEAQRTASFTKDTRARQLDAMSNVVAAMRGSSGIRHLVILTQGIHVHKDLSNLVPITRAAAGAGVQISVVMEEPDGMTMAGSLNSSGNGRTDSGLPKRIREDNVLALNGAQTVTDMVGGAFYRLIGTGDASFAKILDASAAVYRLGVELPAGAQPGKELSLGVNIRRPGLTVRAGKMALSPSEPMPEPSATPAVTVPKPGDAPMITGPVLASVDDVLKSALNENRSLRGVPIRLGATVRRSASAPGQIDISVNVLFPSSVKTPITAMIGLVDETNALRISKRVVDNTSQPVQFLFPVAAGSYAIRFGASAADGALGTIELPIAAKLHTMGAFTTSDVLTYFVGDTSQKASLFTVDDAPAPAEPSTYHASIELYPAGAMPSEPPVINWTITREGETKPIVDEDGEGRVGKDLFRADFEIPYATLPPGKYIVRATLLIDDKPAGSVGLTLRKK